MKFRTAYVYLRRGHRIKLPEWGGYWNWDNETQTIMIHTKEGTILDIRDTDDVGYTVSFMCREDWEIVD